MLTKSISTHMSMYILSSSIPSPSPPGTCEKSTTVSDHGSFVWLETSVDETGNVFCPHGPPGAFATRLCMSDGNWGLPNVTNCANPKITAAFTNLAEANVTASNVASVSQNLSTLVSQVTEPGDQNTNNLVNISSLLNKTASLFANPIIVFELSTEDVESTTESTVQVLNSIQNWPPHIVEAQSNVIVQSFERILDALMNQENFTNLTVIETGIAFQGLRIKKQDFIGITFIGSSISGIRLSVDSIFENNRSTHLNELDEIRFHFPSSIINVTKDADINVVFVMYNETTLFPLRESDPDTVVGTAVTGAKVGGIPDGTALPDNVTMNFTIREENATNHHCVYWNFSAAGGKGNWTLAGCTTYVINTSFVTCVCNHLTNFACLVDIGSREGNTPPPKIRAALNIFSIIGVFVSLLGLLLTIITLIIIKKFRERDVSKFHIQLCLSLIFMLIVFVAGIDRVSVRVGCVTVGVLIHYFALVSWMWMGAEAVMMFQKLVIVFSNITWKYILFVSIICWAVPLLPLTITVSIDPDFYIYGNASNNEYSFCFIGELMPFLTAFLIPVFLILLFNLVIFVIIIIVVIKHNLKKNKRLGKSMKTKDAIKMLIPLAGVMLLFGLTWIFGVFTFISEPGVSNTVQFLFIFFNAFQGFFIFLFFVIFSSESRDAWRAFFYREKRNISSNKTAVIGSSQVNTNRYKTRVSSLPQSNSLSDTVNSTSIDCSRRDNDLSEIEAKAE
ncbi:PREDICTED: adhesion G-protein coupled receptor G2-like [Amphimedon queenslandica]|nr:PREDICTED: adhesion G-protein coupled receptor G2-like [Amphimedon queenslandica]|eukprot:XP_003385399.2 PREDICTED: adhesion G-protein coupled receptor G2-like [Amphimedon queenslandica]